MMQEVIKIENNSKYGLVVSSRIIAERLGKRHTDVIRDLDNIYDKNENLENADLRYALIPTVYTVQGQKRRYKEYLLTKDGFTLYMFNIQGYLDFKIAYINKFNEMEQMLKQPQQVQIKLPKPYELVKKYYNGIPVMSILDLEYVFKVDRYSLHAYIKKFNISGIFLQGDELKKFKRDNASVLRNISCMYVFDFNSAISLGKAINKTDKQKNLVGYYGMHVNVEGKYNPSDVQIKQAELLFKLTESMDYNFKHFFREYASYLIVGKNVYNNYKLALKSNKVKNELRSIGKDIVAESAYEYKMTNEYMELPSNVKTYIDNMYVEVLNM